MNAQTKMLAHVVEEHFDALRCHLRDRFAKVNLLVVEHMIKAQLFFAPF